MQNNPLRILGIDPGSRITGYAVIEFDGLKEHALQFGCIHGNHKSAIHRLHEIYSGLRKIIIQHQPSTLAIETVFVNKNVQSALKLGQARGAALVACAEYGLDAHEYNPRQIKQAITGFGAASKHQIQTLMRHHFNLSQTPNPDAADALAIALCHRYHANWQQRIDSATEST